METTATPVARPRFAAHDLLGAGAQRRTVVAEALGVALAIRTGGASALLAHDPDVAARLLAV